MSDDAASAHAGQRRIDVEGFGRGTADGYTDSGSVGQPLVAAASL